MMAGEGPTHGGGVPAAPPAARWRSLGGGGGDGVASHKKKKFHESLADPEKVAPWLELLFYDQPIDLELFESLRYLSLPLIVYGQVNGCAISPIRLPG